MWQILLYVALGVFSLYLYTSRNNNYWKKLGLPYIPPKPFIGSIKLPFFNKKPLHEWELEYYKKYRPIYGHFEGSKPVINIAVPELIRDINVKDFNVFPTRRTFEVHDEMVKNMVSILSGERWKKVRTAMTPAFSSGKMRKMAHLINECSETTCNNLKTSVQNETPVDVKKVFGAFTMDVIATTAFGMKIDSHNDPDNPFIKHAKKVFSNDITLAFVLIFVFPLLAKIFRPNIFPKDSMEFFAAITENIIKERKKNPEVKHYDFLQILLDELTEMPDDKINKNGTPPYPEKGLTKVEILSQCVLFFIAGYETTASAVSLTVYNLAMNPDCQDKLAEEIRKMLKENDNIIDYDTIKKLPYLNACFCESLRMFSPATRSERKVGSDYNLGDTGITLPKGMIVSFPIYCIHHDPEYFPEPEKFIPDRFLPENVGAINPFTFIPFGAGPRNCLAERFANLESKLLLTKVISQFKFRITPETSVPPKFFSNQGLMVPREIILKVEKRE